MAQGGIVQQVADNEAHWRHGNSLDQQLAEHFGRAEADGQEDIIQWSKGLEGQPRG
jgi:hypothetical protein